MPDESLLEYPELRPFLLGVVERCGQPPAVCYDRTAVLNYLTRELGDADLALEHFEYNIIGGYVGPATPFFLDSTLVAEICGVASQFDGTGSDSSAIC